MEAIGDTNMLHKNIGNMGTCKTVSHPITDFGREKQEMKSDRVQYAFSLLPLTSQSSVLLISFKLALEKRRFWGTIKQVQS